MTVIFIRTLIVYTLLIIIMRIMGKRQIGQLEVTDFVTTLLISEIATLPIENPDLPIANALIPMITLLTFEVASSTILSRTPKLKILLSSRPGYLIRCGRLDQKEMMRNRISPDELMSELRQNGYTDLSEVAYAIIEQDGKLTVIPRAENRPLTPKDININVENSELSHIIIAGGVINEHGLRVTGKSRAWLDGELQKKECRARDVFLMTLGDSGHINIIMKEKG
jgi:uncharacterized membrane protein YcaP (DUF421 family)